MSAEHGGHGPQESRIVVWSREKLKVMIEVVGKSFHSLANVLLSIISLGKLNAFQEASEGGHGGHH